MEKIDRIGYNGRMELKKLPIGLQTFRELIHQDYLYVDKTEYIHRMITGGGKYFFLSRPRRFGKSLLVSTLAEIFKGQQDLFSGLWLGDQLAWENYHHPVVLLDFSGKTYANEEELKDTLRYLLNKSAGQNGIQLTETGYDKQFEELIIQLSSRGQVVVLVDEYDKPIIDFVDKPDTAMANRDILRNFYGCIKSLDEHLRFVFLTGVSKFSKVSVFSGLNNLRDITVSDEYASMLGYSQSELELYFDFHIKKSMNVLKLDLSAFMSDIRTWYNGYSWNGRDFVYNPFSVLNFFQENRFKNYWFSSGTPTFLIKQIVIQQRHIPDLESLVVGEAVLESFDIERLELDALLFQTGYLTIKRQYDMDGSARYELGYPNREVRESFVNHLMQYVSQQPFSRITSLADTLTGHLHAQEIPELIDTMKSIFADIPYDLSRKQNEGFFHSIFYLCLRLIGASIACEIETNRGRMDAVLETADTIYVLEFKMGDAKEGLAQIRQKGYAEKFRSRKKAIQLVSIGFDQKKRNIGDWLLETDKDQSISI
jgi:hypothetical protein